MRANLIVSMSLVAILVSAQGCELLEGLFGPHYTRTGRPEPMSSVRCSLVDHQFILPGTCALFANPCARGPDGPPPDGQWQRGDYFAFGSQAAEHTGASVETTIQASGPPTRKICVAANVPPVLSTEVDFLYVPDPRDFRREGVPFGTGRFFLSTASAVQVSASATPGRINPGGFSQLRATPSGGLPPYTFLWDPVDTLDLPNVESPIAIPTTTTIYDVLVTDSLGQNATASVAVNAGSTLVVTAVTASPSTIDAGETSQLAATASGGFPPYAFAWVPSRSLVNAGAFSPVARPANTTTYVVTVTDSAGDQMTGSVTLAVNLIASAHAIPPSIFAGEASQLFATIQGGTLPHSYAWSPAASLNDPASARPFASPGATTTYTMVVTDGAGGNASASTTVTVAAGGPTACFTYTNNTGLQQISLDASCTTGSVVRYEWDFSFEPGHPDLIRFGPLAVWEYGFGSSGTITLTVFDAGGASASTSLPFP